MKFVSLMLLSVLAACVVSCVRFGVTVLVDGEVGLACGFFVWMVIAVVVGYFVFDLRRGIE